MSEFVVRSTTHLLKWLHTLWLLKTISNSGHENYPYKWGQPDFSNFEKFTFVTWSPIDHELVLKWSSKGQNLKVSSTVISAMFTFKVLEIETFFSHDSTALVCLVIVDILLFSIMIMICDQWTVALQERSIVTVPCRANIAIVITANANTVTVLRDMVIAINYLHIISSNYCWTTREMNNIL